MSDLDTLKRIEKAVYAKPKLYRLTCTCGNDVVLENGEYACKACWKAYASLRELVRVPLGG
jgi:hypothetical protein